MMKFTELAEAIDTATEEVAFAENAAIAANTAIDALKQKQGEELAALVTEYTAKTETHTAAASKLYALYEEMRGKMSRPVVEQSAQPKSSNLDTTDPAALKQMFLQGQRLRR